MSRFTEESQRYYSKYIGVVEISDPTAVTTRLSTIGSSYDNGMVWCSCPELGFEGMNLIPCRYGLSLPFYKVKDKDRVWIEPTIGHTERWVYSGFVDCGRDAVAPATNDQVIILNETGKFTFTMGAMSIVLNSMAKTILIDTNGDAKAKILLDATTPKIDIISTGNISITDGTNTIALKKAGGIEINGSFLTVAAP